MIILLLLLQFHDTEQEYIYSNKPVPKAELLDEVLSKLVNRTDFTGSLFSYLTGNDDFGDPDNLDVCILDANNVFKIISKVKKQYQPSRRDLKDVVNPSLVRRSLDLMRQSIYATRYRMQETKRYRQRYTDDARFQLAVFYGALMQVTLKMETLYTMMVKFKSNTRFIWYLIVYEKILAAHVDVHNFVERIFELHNKQVEINKGNKKVRLVQKLVKPKGTRTRASRGTGRRFTTRHVYHISDMPSNMTFNDNDAENPELAFTQPSPPPKG